MKKYYEIELVYKSSKPVKGKPTKEIKTIKGIGTSQKIFQSRIDNQTQYTMRLTQRLKVTFDVEDNFLDDIDFDKNSVDYAIINYNSKKMKFAVLNIEQICYNEYIIELGEVR